VLKKIEEEQAEAVINSKSGTGLYARGRGGRGGHRGHGGRGGYQEIRFMIERESNIDRSDEDVEGNVVALGREHNLLRLWMKVDENDDILMLYCQ
jgi:hypothetical protein